MYIYIILNKGFKCWDRLSKVWGRLYTALLKTPLEIRLTLWPQGRGGKSRWLILQRPVNSPPAKPAPDPLSNMTQQRRADRTAPPRLRKSPIRGQTDELSDEFRDKRSILMILGGHDKTRFKPMLLDYINSIIEKCGYCYYLVENKMMC